MWQLPDHAAEGIAEGCQKIHTMHLRGRAATQTLAVNGDMPKRSAASARIPESRLQACHIKPLEQLAPDRRTGTRSRLIPRLASACALNCRPQRTIPS